MEAPGGRGAAHRRASVLAASLAAAAAAFLPACAPRPPPGAVLGPTVRPVEPPVASADGAGAGFFFGFGAAGRGFAATATEGLGGSTAAGVTADTSTAAVGRADSMAPGRLDSPDTSETRPDSVSGAGGAVWRGGGMGRALARFSRCLFMASRPLIALIGRTPGRTSRFLRTPRRQAAALSPAGSRM